MKLMTKLVILGAMFCFASPSDAATRQLEFKPVSGATSELIVDGTDIIIEAEAHVSLHWSPSRGFHYGRNCCKRQSGGRSARVSSQRFSGIDAAAGRPVYVRGRF